MTNETPPAATTDSGTPTNPTLTTDDNAKLATETSPADETPAASEAQTTLAETAGDGSDEAAETAGDGSDEAAETEDEGSRFEDWGLEPEILQALIDMGYERPMDVQTAVYRSITSNRDVMVQARTGTGKTAAFGIPIMQKIPRDAKEVRALLLAPTRELALQVARELQAIGEHKGLQVVPIYGGAPMRPQIDALQGGAQVVAGTPGRVLDHIGRGTLKTDKIDIFVLDECDEMLSMGFAEEIDKILAALPDRDHRQTLLFSATIPDAIQRIANRHQRDPEKISLSTGGISVDEIDHFYYVVSGMGRTRDLLKVLQSERPDQAIIFCNTREDTNTVAKALTREGFSAQAISSDLTQKERERAMARMREGKIQYLCATDVAARGIDINDLSHVINYSFPESPEVYVHRTGRTGRAGKRGVAISLVGPREIGSFYYLKLTYKIRPEERDLPSNEELAALKEGAQYERLLTMVSEAPSAQYRSLARRLWQSSEGERIVGVLLERLFREGVKPATEKKRAPEREESLQDEGAEREEREERGEEPEGRRERGRRPRDRDRDRDGRRERSRSRDRDRDRDRDEKPRRRRRRRDRDERDGEAREAKPAEGAADTSRAEAATEAAAEAPATPPTEAAAEKPVAKKAAAKADGGDKEFWETWADEKTQDDRPPRKAEREQRDDGSVRLYVNLGKREEVTAKDLRALLAEGLSEEDAAKLGSVAVRSTHCYVRVADEVADRVIELASGKTFKDREVVVERAKR